MKCEFSLEHYAEIMESNVRRFGSIRERRQVVIAHDIDILPKYALAMAELEFNVGVTSTYYILPYAEFYNSTSPENIEVWKQISEMGHELGFHYDGRYAPDLTVAHKSLKNSIPKLGNEIALHLNGLTPQPEIPSHLHDRRIMDKEGYNYLADSGGWWRDRCICQHKGEKILFVCHPVWWSIGTENLDRLEIDLRTANSKMRVKWDGLVYNHRKVGGYYDAK